MLGSVLGGLGVAVAALAVLYRFVRPAPAIWRGDASAVPAVCTTMVAAHARTYLSFLLCLGTATTGVALGGVGFALAAVTGQPVGEGWPVGLAATGFLLLLSNVVLVPLNWFVDATGRPKLLVPPPYRDQPGSIAAGRRRHRRRRSGRAETDHLVEIFEVRPEPDDGQQAAFYLAICADDECGWTAFADRKLRGPSEEEQVRAKARQHSTNVAADVQRRP
ncbi:MAG TPA: hypothetical protein VFB84_00020 [Micromonosporaceae bacterium]|nr:hypothetical protein [Micromonosporaceae bacterium]